MGQTQSASLPSKAEILAKTKGGTTLVNELFQWMISQANIRDFYLMANPDHCKKYILLTADVLNKIFYKIDVVPKEGPKGMIYFRKADVINPQSKDDPIYKHRQINCLRLAFLYIRIFQIFAALSLTILDAEPEMELKLINDVTRLRERESVPLFGQRGGALNSKRSLPSMFEPLRSSLSEIPTNPSYYKFTGTSIYIEFGARTMDGSLPLVYNFVIPKNGKTEARSITGRILVERPETDKLTVHLFGLKLTQPSGTRDLDKVDLVFRRRSIENVYRRGPDTIAEGMDRAMRKISMGESVGKEDEEVPTGTGQGRSKERPGFPEFEKEMGEVAEGLHTKTILSAFTRATPPKAHCMARALQLISDKGFDSMFPKEVYSSICKTKFMADSRSLPPANERITKEDGIYALAQMFYDTIKEATPQISDKSQEQYKAFVAKMKFVFEESKAPTTKLDTVLNKIPSSVCDPSMLDKSLKISNRDLIRQLRDTVRRMTLYQINHTANATKILKKLFLLPMESGKSLQIHPRVLKLGMEEINAIAEETRELLVEYYSQCEILYRSGAEIIAGNKSLVTAI